MIIELIQLHDTDNPELGYLPIVKVDGEEVYRGEYHNLHCGEALRECNIGLRRHEGRQVGNAASAYKESANDIK